MNMEQLLKEIKETENQIQTLKNLEEDFKQPRHDERCAGISCRGSWSVWFTPSEVEPILQRRSLGLQVKLGRLLEAKKAAEITMEGWLNLSKGDGDESQRDS